MAIRKYYVNHPKDGYQYDRKEGKYFSWGYDAWIGGERIRERGLTTRQKAEESIAHLKQQARNDRFGLKPEPESPTLFDLFQRKLDAMPPGNDRKRAKRVMAAFLKLLPAQLKVMELRSAHLQSYVQERTTNGVSPATIRREMVPIVAALHSAGHFFESLEGYRPPKIMRPKIPKTRKSKVISPDELNRLLSWLYDPKNDTGRGLSRRVGLFLHLCILTASRPGEIAHLRKQDVDLDSMLLRIEGTKTRFESVAGLRYLNISPTMASILTERMKQAETDYLFTRSGIVTSKMYERFKTACEKTGIPYGRSDLSGITFVRTRHTGITNMIRSGADIQTVGAIVGHSNSTMTMHYTHGDPEAIKRAIFELDKNFEGPQDCNIVNIRSTKRKQEMG